MNLFGEQRKQMRAQCRIPLGLACTSYKTNMPFQVTIYNINDNGLYLETTRELEPDDEILIHAVNHTPLGITARLLSENVGIIRWLKTIQRGNSHFTYGAGISFY
jgi:hypothetical protein